MPGTYKHLVLAAIIIIIIIYIIKDSIGRTFTSRLKDKYIHKLGSKHYVKLGPNFETFIALISQLVITHYICVLFPFTSNTACYGLNCVLSKRNVKVLISNMPECDLIWK